MKSGFRTYELCDLGQASELLYSWVPSSVKWDVRTLIAMGDCEVSSCKDIKPFLLLHNLNAFVLKSWKRDYIQFHSINIFEQRYFQFQRVNDFVSFKTL